MTELISTAPEPPKITTETVPETTRSPESLKANASRISYALGDQAPPQTQMNVLGFTDQYLRQQASIREQIAGVERKRQEITGIVKQSVVSGVDLSGAEAALIKDIRERGTASDPNTVIERKYAERYVEDLLESLGIAPEDPEEGRGMRSTEEMLKELVAQQEIARTVASDVQNRFQKQNWGHTAFQFVAGLAPGVSWANTHDRVDSASGFFQGENIASQIRALNALPPDEYREALTKAVDEIAEFSIFDAMLFSSAAVKYSATDVWWDNAFSVIDAVDIGVTGTGIALGKFAGRTAKVVKEVPSTAPALAKAVEEAPVLTKPSSGWWDSALTFEEPPSPIKTTFEDVTYIRVNSTGRSVVVNRPLSSIESSQAKAISGVQAQAHPSADNVTRAVGQGAVQEAAEVQVVEKLAAVVEVGNIDTLTQRTADLMETGFGLNDPSRYLKDAGTLSNTAASRLLDNLTKSGNLLKSTLTDVISIERLGPEALQGAFAAARADFLRLNARLEDSIVDIRNVQESDVYGGVDRIDVLMGTKDASGFSSDASARLYATDILKLQDTYDIVLDSGNYFIRVTKVIDETSDDLTSLRLATGHATPASFSNTWLGYLKGADNILGASHSKWRKAAVGGGNATLQRIADSAKTLGRLSRAERRNLGIMLNKSRVAVRKVRNPDGTITQVRGAFFDDVNSFQKAYQKQFGKLPSKKQIEAYFNFRQIMDLDFVQRNLAVYRDLARQGIEKHTSSFSIRPEGAKNPVLQERSFEGKTVESLPTSDHTVAWVTQDGSVRFGLHSKMHGGQRKELDKALEDGKIIQVLDQDLDFVPSRGEGVDFIVVKGSKTGPIETQRIAHTEGGHWNYDGQGVFVKQPQVHRTGLGRLRYTSDTTMHHFKVPKDGAKFLDRYETARKMLVDIKNGTGSKSKLQKYLAANLPYDYKSFSRLFSAKGSFKLDTPFALTRSGQRVGDLTDLSATMGETVHDSSRNIHSMDARVHSEYTQERGEVLTTIKAGNEASPVFSIEEVPMIDSLETLTSSSAGLASARVFEDYKHQAVENWAAQFADVIDAPRAEVIADPVRFMTNPQWRSGVDVAQLGAAKSARRAITNLINMKTTDGRIGEQFREAIVNTLGDTLAGAIIEPHLWRNEPDAGKVLRAVAFHAYLGLFNGAQTLLQGLATANAIAIDGNPLRAIRATFGYTAMKVMALTDGNRKFTRAYQAKLQKATGLTPSTLDEMYEVYKDTGISVISGENSRLNDYLNPDMFFASGPVNGALEAGKIPFNVGNDIHKGVSYTLAFLRWRDENPGKAITNIDKMNIAARTDTLYQNMTKASDAAWQSNALLSIPGQFLSFSARLQAQLLGKGLTPAEKTRLVLMNMTLYGGAAGAAIVGGPFWPLEEEVDKALLANDVEAQGGIAEILQDGILSTSLEMTTGTEFDVGGRFGPGGMSWLKDLKDGNSFDALGAGPNFLVKAFSTSEPFTRAIYGVFYPESGEYNLQAQDFINVLRNISSVEGAHRAYYIHTAGEWMTKTGMLVADGLPQEDWPVTIAVALGLTPQEVSDAYLTMSVNRDFNNARKALNQDITREFDLAVKYTNQGDHEMADQYMQRAAAMVVMSGMSQSDATALMRRAVRDNDSLQESVNERFNRNNPGSTRGIEGGN